MRGGVVAAGANARPVLDCCGRPTAVQATWGAVDARMLCLGLQSPQTMALHCGPGNTVPEAHHAICTVLVALNPLLPLGDVLPLATNIQLCCHPDNRTLDTLGHLYLQKWQTERRAAIKWWPAGGGVHSLPAQLPTRDVARGQRHAPPPASLFGVGLPPPLVPVTRRRTRWRAPPPPPRVAAPQCSDVERSPKPSAALPC